MDVLGFHFQDTVIVAGFFAATLVPALVGIVLGAIFKSNKVANVVASLCIVSCAVSVSTYPLWHLGLALEYTLPIPSAIGEYRLAIDQLTACMISFSSVIFMLIVVHVVKSTSDSGCRYSALLNALFLACFSCMSADSVLVLLFSWELVTLTTFLLSKKGNNDHARWMFFAIAHLGGMVLICAYSFMASVAGTQVLSQWDGLSSALGHWTSMALIMAIVMGFGTKLGLIPFHAWMPDLYATAPIHTATLLSTVCSNVAILMVFKTVFSYIGITAALTPIAFAIVIIAVATALWGALESLVQREPKKLLAYSSMENMALVVLCMALGIIYIVESPALAKLVLVAGLLHTLNHSVFKSLMLMSIDTVEDCTGEKNIGRMGGLSRTLPALSAVAIIGILAMAAVPPTNGFVSEWLMIQSLMGADLESKGMSLVIPLILAAVGICGMMMAASYARLYGFIFLGRPRSEAMENPRPMKRGTILPLALLAALCLGMGLFAMTIMDVLAASIVSLIGMPPSPGYRSVMSGELLPLVLGTAVVATVAVLYWASKRGAQPEREVPTWSCGEDLDENMQYSSIGFTQPLVKVFHPFYGDTTVVRETKDSKVRTVIIEFVEPFVKYLYKPLGALLTGISERIGKTQTGNIQTYFAYVLITLVVTLLAVRVF
ncbi:MAG: hypothetical protein GX224_06775 [Thermoplasmatales archaeon]|nr:hypothetical protein [Thermoplasmatales archaeon]